jgi:hypothetical protein
MLITRETTLEEIVESKPQSVNFLANKGIRCIVCGEVIWGSIADIADSKGFSIEEINHLIDELNTFLKKPDFQ